MEMTACTTLAEGLCAAPIAQCMARSAHVGPWRVTSPLSSSRSLYTQLSSCTLHQRTCDRDIRSKYDAAEQRVMTDESRLHHCVCMS